MKHLLIISLLFLSACSKESIPGTSIPKKPVGEIDSALSTYVNGFYSQATTRGLSLPKINISIADSVTGGGNDVVGVCVSWSNGDRQVEVKRSYWNTASDLSKYNLIFHELGHCLLNRNHLNTTAYSPTLMSQVPVSMMYPYIITSYPQFVSLLNTYWTSYVEELFDASKITVTLGIVGSYATDSNEDLYIVDIQQMREHEGCDHAQ